MMVIPTVRLREGMIQGMPSGKRNGAQEAQRESYLFKPVNYVTKFLCY